jgi:exosortase/archaeosortase family protein
MPPNADGGDLRIRADVLAGLRQLEVGATPSARAARTRTAAAFDWHTAIRPLVALAIVIAAYRVTFSTLFELMRLDTPLAHLALVPFIALALAYAIRNNDAGPAIYDRQLDWIVGLFLIAVALVCSVILPARLSTQYWIWRLDLLTMPIFVAGVVTLFFGVRTLWKYRLAVGFLFLAWPYPYTIVLEKWLDRFTQITIWGLDVLLNHYPLAVKVAGSTSNFLVTKNGLNLELSVASACSGANGLVGFVLVAGAFLMVVDGSKLRKFAWLALGALLVWALNILRIMIIFWSAGKWGERVALDGFHPYVGLVVFNIAIVIMVVLLRPFGLRIRGAKSPISLESPKRSMPRFTPAFACVGVIALGIGLYNAQLRDYDRIATSLGAPRLTDFATSRETPAGWALSEVATYDWSQRFFGKNSNWTRYNYVYTGSESAIATADGPDTALTANIPITVDVIKTPDRAALNAYGIEQCYTFHGYSITGRQSIDLGEGLVAGILTWTSDETSTTWTTLYWHWPIKTESGTQYERVTLVMNDQPSNRFTSPELTTDTARQFQLDINDALRGVGSPEDKARLVETRQFMVGFARELVRLRAAAPDS